MKIEMSVCASVLCLLMGSVPAVAKEDAAFIGDPAARNAATYDSPSASDRGKGYVAPSTRGRPGYFFYKKGAEAFKRGQIAFAIEMYELSASYAYKPAQYNLAVIYAKGQGVPVNLPRAMAWSALAAERGDQHYVAARDAINVVLNEEQVAQTNSIITELRLKYADKVAMRVAKSRWKDAKLEATGSRLGFVGGLKVGAPGNSFGRDQKTPDGISAGVSTSASEISGGKQIDGSIAYRELQETDNPYDPKLRVRSGTATVGPISTTDADAEVNGDERTSTSNPGKN